MKTRHVYKSNAARAIAGALIALLMVRIAETAEPAPAAPAAPSVQRMEVVFPQSDMAGYMPGPPGPPLSPADPNPIPAVDCVNHCPPGYEATWKAIGPVWGFQEWAQGEYVGRARISHVPVYRLRVDDELEFVFRVTRNEMPSPYKINVGDELSIESSNEPELRRTLVVLPDGTITVPLLGQIRAAQMTVGQLRDDLDKRYERFYNVPAITVTPVKVDTKLEDLRFTVSGRSGFGGQFLHTKITPEGTIQLPAVGSVPAQGLTLDEFRDELAQRFGEKIEGIEVMPVLKQRAPRYVYVLGEVKAPGRYTLEAPTTVMQAISMAGSWTVGGQITHVVVFRRADDWRLIATVPMPGERDLGQRCGSDHRAQVEDSAGRQLHRPGLHSRHLRRCADQRLLPAWRRHVDAYSVMSEA
jgi:polysaccharide biosynthesis/export protein